MTLFTICVNSAHTSSPRKRGPSGVAHPVGRQSPWVPAFAGTTGCVRRHATRPCGIRAGTKEGVRMRKGQKRSPLWAAGEESLRTSQVCPGKEPVAGGPPLRSHNRPHRPFELKASLDAARGANVTRAWLPRKLADLAIGPLPTTCLRCQSWAGLRWRWPQRRDVPYDAAP